jgi:hypothetical protein
MRYYIPLVSAYDSFRSLQTEFKFKTYFIWIALYFVHRLNAISVMKVADCGVVTRGARHKKNSDMFFAFAYNVQQVKM